MNEKDKEENLFNPVIVPINSQNDSKNEDIEIDKTEELDIVNLNDEEDNLKNAEIQEEKINDSSEINKIDNPTEVLDIGLVNDLLDNNLVNNINPLENVTNDNKVSEETLNQTLNNENGNNTQKNDSVELNNGIVPIIDESSINPINIPVAELNNGNNVVEPSNNTSISEIITPVTNEELPSSSLNVIENSSIEANNVNQTNSINSEINIGAAPSTSNNEIIYNFLDNNQNNNSIPVNNETPVLSNINENNNSINNNNPSKIYVLLSIVLIVLIIGGVYFVFSKKTNLELICDSHNGEDITSISMIFKGGKFSSGTMNQEIDLSTSTDEEIELIKKLDYCAIAKQQYEKDLLLFKSCDAKLKEKKYYINIKLDVSSKAKVESVDVESGKKKMEQAGYNCIIK